MTGKVAINANAFKAYCEVLGLSWQAVVDEWREGEVQGQSGAAPAYSCVIDWASAPDDAVFYGRQGERQILKQWVVEDRCRLVTLMGMGGIGKTALSVRVVKEIVATQPFDYLILAIAA